MSKTVKIVVLAVAATLLSLFVILFFLCVPLFGKGSILPIGTFYVTSIVIAALFVIGAIISLFCRFRGLTRRGRKYYDNTNTLEDNAKEGNRK